MNSIIIDANRGGCTIWFGNVAVQEVKGTPIECCDKIYNYVMETQTHSIKDIQVVTVALDRMGYGSNYWGILNNMGVKLQEIKYLNIIKYIK